jgi:hypothetical protein
MGGNVKSYMTELAALLKAAGRDHRMIIYPPMAVTAINCSSRWAPTGRT